MLAIYAVTQGLFDDIPAEDISRAERELREFVRVRHAHLLDTIKRTGKLPDAGALEEAISAFKDSFGGGE